MYLSLDRTRTCSDAKDSYENLRILVIKFEMMKLLKLVVFVLQVMAHSCCFVSFGNSIQFAEKNIPGIIANLETVQLKCDKHRSIT